MSGAQTQVVALEAIRVDGGTQPRGSINLEMVAEYTSDMRNGAVFPPVVVFLDGVDLWLADGFHRYHAARAVPQDTILVEVRKGTRRDAVLFSLGANGTHGARRTNADKRRAVGIALADPEWSKNSDRWIAEVCGVSHTFVQGLRPQLASVASSSRVGKDGRERQLPEPRPSAEVPAVPVRKTPFLSAEEDRQRELVAAGPEAVREAAAAKRGPRLSAEERARLLAMADPTQDQPVDRRDILVQHCRAMVTLACPATEVRALLEQALACFDAPEDQVIRLRSEIDSWIVEVRERGEVER